MKVLQVFMRSGDKLLTAQLPYEALAEEMVQEFSDGTVEIGFIEGGIKRIMTVRPYYRRWYGEVLKVYCDEVASQ